MQFDPQTKKRALNLIFFILLMDLVGMSIIFPVAPYIVQRYSEDALMVTMLTVIYASAQFFAAPALGKISASPWTLGLLMVCVGIATAFVQASLVERFVPRYGEKRMALVALIGTAFGWLLLMAAPSLWMLFPIASLQAGITGFIWATTSVMAANHVSENEQGSLAGVNVALAGLMSMLGPLWSGFTYDHVMPSAPYWMGAIIIGVASLLLIQVKAQNGRQVSAPSPAD